MSIISWTSPRLSCRILPVSSVIIFARSGLNSRSQSPISRTSSPRFGAGTFRQRKKACCGAPCGVIRVASRHPPDRLAIDRREADKLSAGIDASQLQEVAQLLRRVSCQQLLRLGHRIDACVDRFIFLAETKPHQVADGIALRKGRKRDDGNTARARRLRPQRLHRQPQCRTPEGRHTGNRSRSRQAP